MVDVHHSDPPQQTLKLLGVSLFPLAAPDWTLKALRF